MASARRETSFPVPKLSRKTPFRTQDMKERNDRERARVTRLREASLRLANMLPDGNPSYGRLSDRRTYHAAVRYIKTLREVIADMDASQHVAMAHQATWTPYEIEQYNARARKSNQEKLNRVVQQIMMERVPHKRPTGTKKK